MTRIRARSDGSIVTTIPKGDAETLRLQDEWLSWHVESRDRLRADPEGTEQPRVPATRVQFNEAAGQYTVAIPSALAYAMRIVPADVEWDADYGKLYGDVQARGGDSE